MRISWIIFGLLALFFGVKATLFASINNLNTLNLKPLESYTILELENQQKKLEKQLETLAPLEFNEFIFRMGYRSKYQGSANIKTWIRINLDKSTNLDQIYLVPVITTDRIEKKKSRGFPTSFAIAAGDSNNELKYHQKINLNEDQINRSAPLILDVDFKNISWFRLDVYEANGLKLDGQGFAQLSEIFLMDQGVNKALYKEVKVPRHVREKGWSPFYLVDGHIPYNMKKSSSSKNVPKLIRNNQYPLELSIDLEQSFYLDELKIHGVDMLDTTSRKTSPGFGMPGYIKIEGSQDSSFSSSTLLAHFDRDKQLPIGQFFSLPLEKSLSQFVRIQITKPWITDTKLRADQHIRISEIELISGRENVALRKTFKSNKNVTKLEALSDGFNTLGKIIPVQDWMTQLALRHDLEVINNKIENELSIRYRERSLWINILIWALAISIIATFIILIRIRSIRKKTIQQTRAMLGADLHDELGANLDALNLYSEMALRDKSENNHTNEVLERIGELSRQSSAIAKKYSKLQDDITQVEHLFTEIRLLAKRFTHGLDHHIELKDEERIEKIPNKLKLQLILFYRECLNNIIRHAKAKKVKTHLYTSGDLLIMKVHDDGIGLPEGQKVASSIDRRARILGGKLDCHSKPSQGTQITLELSLTHNPSWIAKLYERFTIHSHH